MKNMFYLSRQPFRQVYREITGNRDFLVGPYTNQIGYYYRYYIFDHLLLEINKYNNLFKNLRK